MNRFMKFARVLLWPIFLLAGLVTRRKSRWVFGDHRNKFTDNSKYLFTFVSRECPQVDAIWISGSSSTIREIRRRGLKAHWRWSPTGLLHSLTASVYVYNHHVDDINYWTSNGATLVNLWHGTPLKVIEFDILEGPLAHVYNPSNKLFKLLNLLINPHMYVRPHVLTAPTQAIAAILAKAFRIPPSQCVVAGYPRNDILQIDKDHIRTHLKNECAEEALSLISHLSRFKHVFIYMPTWRDDCRDFISDSGLDFDKINEIMARKNGLFIIKLHPSTKLAIPLEKLSNILLLDNNLDVYPILPFTNTLITDYSSIFFDYALMRKEIVFFPYDYDAYTRKSRKMYFEYDEVTPGAKFTDASQLYAFLESNNFLNVAYKDSFSKFVPPEAQYSCDMVSKVLMDLCGLRP